MSATFTIALFALFSPSTGMPVSLADTAGAGHMSSAPASAVADTATMSYEVGGLKVIHRPLAANELVAVNLYLLGGSTQVDETNAGIEPMLLRVSEFGTEGYPGRAARMALARTGSRIGIGVGPDWTVFNFEGLRTEFDSSWAVFADRVMRPTIDSAAVETVRRRMVRSARSTTNHPDAMVRMIADSIVFADHPYRNDPSGTESSLTAITGAELRSYHSSQMVTSRMLLVVVGNVPRSDVEAAVTRTFASLDRGNYTWALPPMWSAPKATVTARARTLPTNYILGYFGGPRADDKDYTAFRIATLLLGGFASGDIRNEGLSYAAYSPYMERGASGGGIYVTTTRPDTTMKIFNHTIRLLHDHVLNRSALQTWFKGFITSYYGENESNGGQADFLARHELLHGDWRLTGRYMEELANVTGPQIRQVARKYIKNIQYVYVGNVELVPEKELTKH
jgi:zinc protease